VNSNSLQVLVRFFSSGSWLVCTSKVYSDMGADIVCGIITRIYRKRSSVGRHSGRIRPFEPERRGNTAFRAGFELV